MEGKDCCLVLDIAIFTLSRTQVICREMTGHAPTLWYIQLLTAIKAKSFSPSPPLPLPPPPTFPQDGDHKATCKGIRMLLAISSKLCQNAG
jgi:hypothetical protein